MNGTMLHVGKNVQWIPAALIVCLALVAFGSAVMLSPPPPGPKPPAAGFFYAPSSNIIVGRALTFDASPSADSDGFITSYVWDFGDGSAASGEVVTHAYMTEGSYAVTVQVTDNQRLTTVSTRQTLYVTTVPQPIITIKFTISPDANLVGWENKWIVSRPVTFDGSEFNEANGYVSNYVWDFGDGATDTDAIVSHIYQQSGTYSVALTVTDLKGAVHTIAEQVTVMDMPATIVYVDTLPSEYHIGDIITLNLMVSDVTDLWAWQAGMTFNPTVLECIPTTAPNNAPPDVAVTAFTEGEFLKKDGRSTLWVPGTVENGVINAHASTLVNSEAPVSGSGVLATAMFRVIGEGSLNIHLTDVILIGSDGSTAIPVYVAT